MSKICFKRTDGFIPGTLNTGNLTHLDHLSLQKLGLHPQVLPRTMCSVIVQRKGKTLRGIGIMNDAGGVEFCESGNLEDPVSLSKNGILFIPLKSRCVARICNMFVDFLDYLSFKTFQEHSVMTFPSDCDYIIINHPSNFLHAMVKSDVYDNINLFMPNNIYGRTITLSIMSRNPLHTTDCSLHYQGFEHFRDFVHSLMSRKGQRWI